MYIAFCNFNLDIKANIWRVNLCCIILPNMSINVKWENETFAGFMRNKYMPSEVENINISLFVCLFLIIYVNQTLMNKRKEKWKPAMSNRLDTAS